MRRRISVLSLLLLVAVAPGAQAAGKMFELRAKSVVSQLSLVDEDENVLDLVERFIGPDDDFAPALIFGATGQLDYLGIGNAITLDIAPLGTAAVLTLNPTGAVIPFSAANVDELYAEIKDWFNEQGSTWADFLRAANGLTPLAVISGNPKSTVALMGDSAYRKFGFDDSRSRFGFGESEVQRVGGFELRIDVGGGDVNTAVFDQELATVDAGLTLAGNFSRSVGLSFSIVGQYRDYNGSKMGDLGLELALPLTLRRPDTSRYFWQLTPFIQAAAGVSIDAAVGGLFMGGGLVSSVSRHFDRFELLMSNEIAYYGGLPVRNIADFNFETKLNQWFFKNGLEGTWFFGGGFYGDGGVHFTNFAGDGAAVPWYATPTVGLGFQCGRWCDIRVAYEADVDDKSYLANTAVLKLDFLF
jgi:hypothetical protein